MNFDQMNYYQSKLSFEIDSSDLYELIVNKENIIVIDGRSPSAYNQEHIPKAINIWHKDMSSQTTQHLDKNAIYICYCDGIGCNASTKASIKLLTLGFKVKELIGGKKMAMKQKEKTHKKVLNLIVDVRLYLKY